jgi:hypothetical protein
MVLAIWRLTRLLVVDEFPPVRAVRDWFIKTFATISPDGDMVGGKHLGGLGFALAYVWTCSWCMSVWVGGAVWAAADWRLSVPYPWLILAAGSALAGVMNMVEGEHDQRFELRRLEIEKNTRIPR